MKFTKSKDGIERTTVRLEFRYSKEEIQEIKQLAKKCKSNWRDWLQSHAALGIEGEMQS